MPQTPLHCLRCRERMQEGFLPHFSEGAARQSVWADGKPVSGPLGGLFGLRMRGKAQVPLTAWRGPSCGYVEMYAKAAENT
jgi:hypothetical protein